jgi:hypothetical protein
VLMQSLYVTMLEQPASCPQQEDDPPQVVYASAEITLITPAPLLLWCRLSYGAMENLERVSGGAHSRPPLR